MTTEIAKLYCMKCRVVYPVVRGVEAPSLKGYCTGRCNMPCPSCEELMIFGGVLLIPDDQGVRETMATLTTDAEVTLDSLVTGGALGRPMEKKKKKLGDIKVPISPEGLDLVDNLRETLAESIDRELTKVTWAHPTEREAWASIGIDFDGEVN